MYAILGCGTVGHLVASSLRDIGIEDLTIMDMDPDRVSNLRERGFEAVEGDMTDEEALKEHGIEKASVVMVLTALTEVNEKSLRLIKKLNPDVLTVARAVDPATADELEELGADIVIHPSTIISEFVIGEVQRLQVHDKVLRLKELLSAKDVKDIAIVIHDNPDPDAISSAMAFREIVREFGKKADIIYGGLIGHQENRALVNLLGIELTRADELKKELAEYSKIALIDIATPGVNNVLSEDAEVNVIIDHHPVEEERVKADFVDLQPTVGSTSTILTQYFMEMEMELNEKIATALLNGIRTDTLSFTRGTHPLDLKVAAYLYPKADHDLLMKIERPGTAPETLDVLAEAIRNRVVKGSYLITNAGFIRDRDALPQAADYLLNLEGVSTAVVYGIGEKEVYISSRSSDVRVNVGRVMLDAFGKDGYAGGHKTAAAARIPLGLFGDVKDKKTLFKLVREAVVKRFFEVVGVEEKTE